MTVRAAVPRVNVLGVGVSAIQLYEATQLIIRAAKDRVRGYVTVTGVAGISEAQSEPALRAIFNHAYLVTPDGMPMTWIGRAAGHASMDRVYGPDLMIQIFANTRDGSVRHFFYGGKESVAEELRVALESRFPGVCICGTYTPPFRPLAVGEIDDLRRQVSAARPDILWVGISTPKQEKFMAEYAEKLDVGLMIGVGAAFDYHSGRQPQAPYWMQRAGLEWLFRLSREPRRLAVRYLVGNPLFVGRWLAQATGLRRYDLPE